MRYAHGVPEKDLELQERRRKREIGRRAARRVVAVRKHEALKPSVDAPRAVK